MQDDAERFAARADEIRARDAVTARLLDTASNIAWLARQQEQKIAEVAAERDGQGDTVTELRAQVERLEVELGRRLNRRSGVGRFERRGPNRWTVRVFLARALDASGGKKVYKRTFVVRTVHGPLSAAEMLRDHIVEARDHIFAEAGITSGKFPSSREKLLQDVGALTCERLERTRRQNKGSADAVVALSAAQNWSDDAKERERRKQRKRRRRTNGHGDMEAGFRPVRDATRRLAVTHET
jgi:hypothetical protein